MSSKRKLFIKDLIVLLIAMSALICAAIHLHISLNKLEDKSSK